MRNKCNTGFEGMIWLVFDRLMLRRYKMSKTCCFSSYLWGTIWGLLITDSQIIIFITLWTIKSATIFLERCRKVVLEIWFEKSDSRKVVDQKKRWFYTINLHFFWFKKSGWPEKKIWVWRTTFLEPLFQKWDRRIKGPRS